MFCMDTLIKRESAGSELLADLGGQKVIVGTKQLKKALDRGGARMVFLAEDADPAITEPLAGLCQRLEVPCYWVGKMLDLGRACGIDVGAAAAAVAG